MRKANKLDLNQVLLNYDEDLAYHKNVKTKGLSILKKMGFKLTPQPVREGRELMPRLPEKPSEMTNTEITDFQADCVTVFGYAKEMRALADAMSEAYKEEAGKVRETIYLQADGTQKDREAISKTSKKYSELNEKRMEWSFVSSLLEAKVSTLDNARQVCSRDVNFRVSEFDAYKRQKNITGRRRESFRDPDDWAGDK